MSGEFQVGGYLCRCCPGLVGFELVGEGVAQGLVQSQGIVEGVDVLEDAEAGQFQVTERRAQFGPVTRERSQFLTNVANDKFLRNRCGTDWMSCAT